MSRVLLVLLLAAAAHAGEPDRVVLAAHGIKPDPESLGAYLRSLQPDERERSEALAAVEGLGSDDPLTRHEALLRLSTLTAPPLGAIREAAASGDVEVRRVAARLLDESLRRIRKDVLLAVLRTIADGKAKGLAREVLGVAPLAAEMGLSPHVAAAVRATLEGKDLAMLRAAASGPEMETRCAAVRALGAAPLAPADEAAPFLEATEEPIRLAAALALADRGDRRCLEPLLALLAADALAVRRGAAGALHAACGAGIGYDPFAAPPSQRKAIETWRTSLKPAPGGWEHPLPLGTRHLGRTLISLFSQARVVEVDAEGRRTFEAKGLEGPWAIQGLPNGHRLVALHPRETIVEYDAEGKEISRMQVPGKPISLQRLDNGNTLVAFSEQDKVVELLPDGSVAAETSVGGQPADARQLENGNLLVCLSQPPRVVEVDRAGRVRWSLALSAHAYTARRLDNGNTLVAETGGPGRAVEFDPAGRVVWERAGLQQCFSAERLPDGSTLVADAKGVSEIAPDGQERRVYDATSFARATRY